MNELILTKLTLNIPLLQIIGILLFVFVLLFTLSLFFELSVKVIKFITPILGWTILVLSTGIVGLWLLKTFNILIQMVP